MPEGSQPGENASSLIEVSSSTLSAVLMLLSRNLKPV